MKSIKSTLKLSLTALGMLCMAGLAFGCAAECVVESSAVTEIDRQRVRALERSDVDGLSAIYADGAVLVHATGRVEKSEDFLRRIENGSLAIVSVEDLSEVGAESFGGAAVASGERAMRVVISSDTLDFKYRFSSVYVGDAMCRPRLVHWGAWGL
ncbi:MAG: nuclear transport factor 2 family protein [Rhodothermia bacterium]|nr:nuclear transport factor 2 family protein [Rhodothermia bacterium]